MHAFCTETERVVFCRAAAAAAERPSSSWLPSRGRKAAVVGVPVPAAAVPTPVAASDGKECSDGDGDGDDGGIEEVLREEMEAMRVAYERKVKLLMEQLEMAGVKSFRPESRDARK